MAFERSDSQHHMGPRQRMLNGRLGGIALVVAVYLIGYLSGASRSLRAGPVHRAAIVHPGGGAARSITPTVELAGRPWPRDPDVARFCEPLDTVAVGIVSSLEPTYQELSRAFLDGWGRHFPNKIMYVVGDVNESSVPDPEVRALTRNAFEGVDTDAISLEVSQGHEGRKKAWKVGQHLFLEATKRLVATFPDAQWYLLADQDTTVRPHCLRSMLEFLAPGRLPVALGDYHPGRKDREGDATLMGGSGILWNAATAAAVDMDTCLRETMVGGAWQGYNSDRRLTRCFAHFGVALVPTLGMHQLSVASLAKQKTLDAWYPGFDTHRCTVSAHRLPPDEVVGWYAADMEALGCDGDAGETARR